MALTSKSLFLYDIQITAQNSSLDFKASMGGLQLNATLQQGFYSLSGICDEVARAMSAADVANVYTCTANRNVSGGLENRLTISTNGAFLSLLFGTGTREASSVATTIGFANSDRTGSTSYAGTASAGTVLIPEMIGYNYLGPEFQQKVFGSVNVSASGEKEAIVFQVQKFIQVEFKYEPRAKVISEWQPFMTWLIQQRPFEFTPEISSPNVFYNVTLEKTQADAQGLSYTLAEMLPDFPQQFSTSSLTFRQKAT